MGAPPHGGEVAGRPQRAFPVAMPDVRALLAQHPAGDALEAIHKRGDRDLGRILHQQMRMIVLAVHLHQRGLEVQAHAAEDAAQRIDGRAVEHLAAVFRHKDQVDVHLENAVSSVSNVVFISHRPRV